MSYYNHSGPKEELSESHPYSPIVSTHAIAMHDMNQQQQQHNHLRDTYGLPIHQSDQSDQSEKSNDIDNNNQQTNYHVSQNDNNDNKNADVEVVKPTRERSRHLPCFPCIRSTWGRVACCIGIFIILVIIIIVILIFTIFKTPTVQYIGAANTPTFSFDKGNATLAMSMLANIQVNNTNPIGLFFRTVDITAYYPGYTPSIGGGSMSDVTIPRKSKNIVEFPLDVSYDGDQDPGYTVVLSLLKQCGLTGSTDGLITINYDAKATMKVIGIPITYTYTNQSYEINCPINISEIASGIPSIISGIGSIISGII
ncbi:hypothetical protein BGZ80_002164 [Entomortierella chlamydospora]|uniref:Late embryogenesis abundant protein LEA-2 subgroup domain-containing protein n=1 Tax=Entomortierella chlamydospora TaxID=101097 RepID=A0A9P6MQQ5_9FUNG|nr:hypothetical protein BGZ79_007591 [Entomortierella chlamydospora]KAG0009679.1 hypothetical protein BGZ80_002164 [Entomortierella chlamydospora]